MLSVVTAVMEYTIKRMNGRPSSFSSSWSRYFWRFFENTFCEGKFALLDLKFVMQVYVATLLTMVSEPCHGLMLLRALSISIVGANFFLKFAK